MSTSPNAVSEGLPLGAPASVVANRLMDRSRFAHIIGKSKCLLEVFDLIENVAASDANILIVGESGTGKELIASAIHDSSHRPEDIPLLCAHFLEKFQQRYQRGVKTISQTAYALLSRLRWPGNVRELENAIERAVLLCNGPEIMPRDLPDSLRHSPSSLTDIVTMPHRTLAEIEKGAILQTLNRTNWNKVQAAAILGVHRPTLYNKMKKYGIREVRTMS